MWTTPENTSQKIFLLLCHIKTLFQNQNNNQKQKQKQTNKPSKHIKGHALIMQMLFLSQHTHVSFPS